MNIGLDVMLAVFFFVETAGTEFVQEKGLL